MLLRINNPRKAIIESYKRPISYLNYILFEGRVIIRFTDQSNFYYLVCLIIKSNQMKKTIKIFFTQILVAFLFATLVISCGNKAKDIDVKAKDIDVSELKTECEATDAMIIVLDETLELAEAVDSEEGVSEEQIKEHMSLIDKEDEITDYIIERVRESDFDDNAFDKCPKYETLELKMKKVKETYLWKVSKGHFDLEYQHQF